MGAGKFLKDFAEPRDHEPLNQAVTGADGEGDAQGAASGGGFRPTLLKIPKTSDIESSGEAVFPLERRYPFARWINQSYAL
ncbi:MAG TPA: hypothetical protein VHF69_03865 [Candidatus Synoicihabitans sp.]|nr:hypothetical protein [Candidatus Synoicihabitans sp.]